MFYVTRDVLDIEARTRICMVNLFQFVHWVNDVSTHRQLNGN